MPSRSALSWPRLAAFPEKGKVLSNVPGPWNFVPFRSVYLSHCGNARTLPQRRSATTQRQLGPTGTSLLSEEMS